MTTTPLHAPFVGGDPDRALQSTRRIIEDAITNQPRSLQRMIGPSEIGTPCDHCLAAKITGWPQTDRGVPWLPYVGTCVHSGIEETFIRHENARNAVHTTGLRYLTEARVMVGHIGDREVWGSTDLVDLEVGMTVDWKVVGAATLKTAKAGPSPVYRVQADLYAKGWNDAGVQVDHVAIAYLPRNAVSLDQAIWWTRPHDRQRAVDALDRANRIWANITTLASISTQARDAWIRAQPRDPKCWDCARYPDGTGIPTPGHQPPAQAAFSDLLVA